MRGDYPNVDQWKKSMILFAYLFIVIIKLGPDTLSYSVTVLTMLDDNPPLVYDIVEGSSNGFKYVDFFTGTALPHIHKKDIVLGDNLNYHCRGWSAHTVRNLIHEVPALYKMQPKYAPEFNPAELVFAFLKQQLRATHSIYDNLLESITSILNSVTIDMMIGWYRHCGWL